VKQKEGNKLKKRNKQRQIKKREKNDNRIIKIR
jgi:hypothetical protein